MSDKEELGVVLAAGGWPPLDWLEEHPELWEHLEAEAEHISAQVQDWPRTHETDPLGAEMERLAQDVRHQGDYRVVEVGYHRYARPSLKEAVERAIARGCRRVVVVPTALDGGMDMPGLIATIQEQHPDVEIVFAGPPFDRQRYADLIVHQVERHMAAPLPAEAGVLRLHSLPAGETGQVVHLIGGRDLVSRLATLGFTPGAEVTMVQNYGHGPVIVAIRGTRIALGRGEAGKVRVRPLDRPLHAGRRHARRSRGWRTPHPTP